MKKGKTNISKMRCSKKTPKNLRVLGTKNKKAREPIPMAKVEHYWK
jgi:hypothetical protein